MNTVASPDNSLTAGGEGPDSPAQAERPQEAQLRPRREALRSRHRLVLLGVAAVFCGAFALEVVPDGRVAVRGVEAYPLPHTCLSRRFFDRGCPACGLTRSFIHLAHGRWEESVAVHRLGWVLAIGVLVQIPYRIAGLLGENPSPLGKRLPDALGWSVMVLLLANWCYNVFA